MDRSELYEKITERKSKPADLQPYTGGNGRVDKCVKLFRQGKLRGGEKLIDVGGAIGDLGYAVRDLFKYRVVVDIADGHKQAAEAKGNEFLNADIDRNGMACLGVEEATTIAALDFIEHIIDPELFAKECFRILQSNGQVFINTPNIRFWPHIQQLIADGTFPHTSGDKEVFHGGHLAFYTYNDMCNIFGSAGFNKFEMVMDEEGYKSPPPHVITSAQPRDQLHYQQLCKEFGCPNLLFICEKP